ncbi:glutathione S-transferase family protein [Pseudohoeflea suaedae]|uniref:Glutathione S-transferase family protein n=1 Tax=Pseudohoeflea suaedae TaxID=877384 RepID=A0A4R5PHK3_9HYPH|nr:glutathione S-transferase family protein [Pseudohoeflea suaedae]TDH34397.1 glutathione S-transferase family protein [Pseudohoeflea suaedae]
MGMLDNGVWKDVWYDTKSTGGKFKRSTSSFRNWVTKDGSAGPSGEGGFKAEAGRYHLYVSLACPWAHRTLIFRELMGLQDAISVDIVDYHMGENGWEFKKRDGATGDSLMDKDYLHQVYTEADPHYTGRVTVPVLWDKQKKTIVSNESAEIIRMFNSAFAGIADPKANDFYPEELHDEIDEINDLVYRTVNNGVYKAGFATEQDVYENNVNKLFDTLDKLEKRLSGQRYLVGGTLTEADWRLFTTLIRFDPVYVGHFKCNIRRIADYPNLYGYMRELYQMPGIAGTVNFKHIQHHYYGSHGTINPNGIVPVGPVMDLDAPHGRDSLKQAA